MYIPFFMSRYGSHLLVKSVACTAAMFIIYFLLNLLLTGAVWQGMTVSKSALTVEYCEFNDVPRFFHQLMNTYSNLVYFFFGVLICLLAQDDLRNKPVRQQNRLQQFPGLSFLMGGCFIYLSFGSAFFHASLTWAGQRVDMNGTYSLTIALVCIALYHVFWKSSFAATAQPRLILSIVLLILLFYPIHLLLPSSLLLPVLILTVWVLTAINYVQFRGERSLWLAISSLVLIIVALKIRTLDVQKIGCDPHSRYQGHSLWHLLAGLSSFCSYAFFRYTPAPQSRPD